MKLKVRCGSRWRKTRRTEDVRRVSDRWMDEIKELGKRRGKKCAAKKATIQYDTIDRTSHE